MVIPRISKLLADAGISQHYFCKNCCKRISEIKLCKIGANCYCLRLCETPYLLGEAIYSGTPNDRSGDCRPVAGDQFPDRSPEVRHVLFGPEAAVRLTVSNLHRRGYAEPNDWCKPQPTGQPGEVMMVLIKRVPLN